MGYGPSHAAPHTVPLADRQPGDLRHGRMDTMWSGQMAGYSSSRSCASCSSLLLEWPASRQPNYPFTIDTDENSRTGEGFGRAAPLQRAAPVPPQ